MMLCEVHESLPRDLLFHSLYRCGEMRVLDVEFFDEKVGARQARRLLRYDDALCFQAISKLVQLLTLLMPGF